MEYSVYVPIFDAPGEPVTVSTWHKSVGQAVKQGEVIAEVDSDTATCEVLCPVSGVLDTIFIGEGKSSQIGAQIAIIVADRTSATSEYISSSNTHTVNHPKGAELEGVFNASPQMPNEEIIASNESEFDITKEFNPKDNPIEKQEINDATAAFTSAEFNAQKVAELEEKIEEQLEEQRILQEEKDAMAAFSSAEFNAQKVAELEEKIEEQLEEQRIIQEEKDAMAAFSSAEFTAKKLAELEEKIEEQLEEQIIQQERKLDNFGQDIKEEMVEEIAREVEKEENILESIIDDLASKKNEGVQVIREFLTDEKNHSHEYYNEKNDLKIASELSKNIAADKPATNPDFWNKIKSIITPNESVKKIGEVEKSLADRRRMAADTAIISTVVNEIDMTAIIDAARYFGDDFFDKHNLPLGFTAFILKIVSKVLKIFPMFNAYIVEGSKVIYKKNYDIAIVTHGMDETPPPVIRGVDMKNIGELQKSVTILSKRAEKGELTLEETSGATFTLINAGAHGSLLGSDAVAYPQIASLTMHKVCQRPVVKDGQVVIRPMMYISMSFDHRISNSKSASMFVAMVKKLSENLSWMALGI